MKRAVGWRRSKKWDKNIKSESSFSFVSISSFSKPVFVLTELVKNDKKTFTFSLGLVLFTCDQKYDLTLLY
jgi:hypothetical protein